MRLLLKLFLAALAVPAAAAAQLDPVPLTADPEFGPPGGFPTETIRYGPEREQRLFLTVPPGEGPHPLVVHVAGADFSRGADSVSTVWIPDLLFRSGFALARIETRRDHRVLAAGVLEDNAAAIAKLVRDAAEHRLDARRIILLGAGAEAHFAALLATEPHALAAAGVPFDSVRGVVGFNGEGFDIPGRLAEADSFRAHFYRKYFGRDAAAQGSLSPAAHLDPPNAPHFLFLAVEDTARFIEQAEAMAAALDDAGAEASVWRIARSRRGTEATYIGLPQHPRTDDLLGFLRRAAELPPG